MMCSEDTTRQAGPADRATLIDSPLLGEDGKPITTCLSVICLLFASSTSDTKLRSFGRRIRLLLLVEARRPDSLPPLCAATTHHPHHPTLHGAPTSMEATDADPKGEADEKLNYKG